MMIFGPPLLDMCTRGPLSTERTSMLHLNDNKQGNNETDKTK